MTRYLLAAPLLSAFGQWTYTPLTVAQAREWFGHDDPYSRIPDQDTATALERVLRLEPGYIPVFPRPCRMRPGDEALVYQRRPRQLGLLRRLQGGGT